MIIQRQDCTVPWKMHYGRRTKATKKNCGPHHSSHDVMCLLRQGMLTFHWLEKYTFRGSPTNRLLPSGFNSPTKVWFYFLSRQSIGFTNDRTCPRKFWFLRIALSWENRSGKGFPTSSSPDPAKTYSCIWFILHQPPEKLSVLHRLSDTHTQS